MGFLRRAITGNEIDEKLYSDQVKDLVNKGVYYKATLPALLDNNRKYTVRTEFAMREPAFMHGLDHFGGDNELSLVFFAPYAWDAVDALVDLKGLARSRSSLELALTSTGETLKLSRERYDKGLTSYFEVLDAGRDALQVQLSLSRIDAEQRITLAALAKSLGGGWNTGIK